jgi:hypothetical protein
MRQHLKRTLCLLLILGFIVFSGCAEEYDLHQDDDNYSVHNNENTNDEADLIYNTGTDDGDVPYYFDRFIPASSRGEIDLDDFVNNPLFSIHENEEIKNNIMNFIFYAFEYDEVDYNDVLSAIDAEDSEGWFDLYPALYQFEDGTYCNNMVDLARFFRKSEQNYRVSHIDANFMMKEYTNDHLLICVPMSFILKPDIGGGRIVYWFQFAKIDSKYKIIGVTVDV